MARIGKALGGGTAGALAGAASGAAIGSFFPVVGTGIGAGVGALLGGLGGSAPGLLDSDNPGEGNFLTGYPAQTQQLQRFTPQQQNALNQLLSQGLGNSNFQDIENRARQQFQTKTIPGLAERFTAMGGSYNRPSTASGFVGQLGSAASDLESQLAALRAQYGMQQLGLGLEPNFESIYIPQQGGLAQGSAQGIGELVGKIPELLQLYAQLKKGG